LIHPLSLEDYMKHTRPFRLPAALLLAALALALAGALGAQALGVVTGDPVIDETTSGNWIGQYGACGYVLSGAISPFGCAVPVLPGVDRSLPPSMPFCDGGASASYLGGGSLELIDRFDLDVSGDGTRDVVYFPYAGCPGVLAGVLRNPDGTCSTASAALAAGETTCSALPLGYSVSGLPAGLYQAAVYVMDGDNLGIAQEISLCIGDVCAAGTVSDAAGGVYQRFLVNVAAGETLELSHALAAGSPSGKVVVQGVFFDPQPDGSSCAAKVCPAGQDTATRGAWTSPFSQSQLWDGQRTYGSQGYILFNRQNPVNQPEICTDVASHILTGGFASPVTVAPLNGANVTWDTGNPPSPDRAMAWVWSVDGDPRALQNPDPAVTVRRATTWTDSGERFAPQYDGDLYMDISSEQAGLFKLSVYAVDYDGPSPECGELRNQVYHLYDFHTTEELAPAVELGDFTQGKYVSWTISGPFKVTLRADAIHACSPNVSADNAITSGIFIDPAPGYTCLGTAAGGCTHTRGYWRTRTQYGPQPFDPGWNVIRGLDLSGQPATGADVAFLETGLSYYQTIYPKPDPLDFYAILAGNTIAAELNVLNGAEMPVRVRMAFDRGRELLIKYQDTRIISVYSRDFRVALLSIKLLAAYNSGRIGPGLCPEE
jgi:hypothetical protein